jgi:DNA ligase (NAD+)
MDLAEVLDLKKPAAGPLSGKTFCITGATSKPRKAVEKIIMDAGGVAKGSVGAGLSFLVTNDPDTGSSKMKSAKKHGVEVISEADLYRMIGAAC